MIYLLITFLIIAVLTAVLMASIIWGLIATGGVPFISTEKKNFAAIVQAAGLKRGETIYDLGCGKAHLLIYAAKNYGASGVGYELSLWPYLWAKLKIRQTKAAVKVYRQNFLKADLSAADVVFCYLFPEAMAKLEPKFERELKPGARVAAYGFKLPKRQPVREVITNHNKPELNKIYIYEY